MSASSSPQDFDGLKIRIEAALAEIMVSQSWPAALKQAVEYSLMAGGKRLRPALVLLGADVCGGNIELALPAACAIEMIHTYSLIHDDLPSMDDDELRRGRPTNHVVFGEALAILAGDALLTLAFETIGSAQTSSDVMADCLRVLATAAGGQGMVGGQILDLEAERGSFKVEPAEADSADPARVSAVKQGNVALGSRFRRNPGSGPVPKTDCPENSGDVSANGPSENDGIHVEQLIQIHRMKTGALITAALELGAAVASASIDQRSRLVQFGQAVGLAFQIADDLLDVTGSDDRLGKETGRDNELGKLTYPSLIGIDASRQKARSLVEEACAALDVFDDRADALRQLARFIVERDH